jgi:hypothetical protein
VSIGGYNLYASLCSGRRSLFPIELSGAVALNESCLSVSLRHSDLMARALAISCVWLQFFAVQVLVCPSFWCFPCFGLVWSCHGGGGGSLRWRITLAVVVAFGGNGSLKSLRVDFLTLV